MIAATSDDETSIVATLRAAGCVFAEDEARLLIEEATTADELAAMVRRRVEGQPLEVIVGWAEFCGLRIMIEPGVFVPRRRTEFLVELAADLAAPGAVVLDLCCGSGAVGAALVRLIEGAELYAADIEPAAVRCARRNLDGLGQVFEGDLFEPVPGSLRGRVDILAANTPYVPTGDIEFMPPEARLHEPRVALDGGDDGLDVQRKVADHARAWLAPGGHLLVEASERQAPNTVAIFERAGLAARTVSTDDDEATVVIGTRI